MKSNSKATLSEKSVSKILDDIGIGLSTIQSGLNENPRYSQVDDCQIANRYSATIAYGRLLNDVSNFFRRESLSNFASLLLSDQLYLSNRNLAGVDNSESVEIFDPEQLSSLLERLEKLEQWLEE